MQKIFWIEANEENRVCPPGRLKARGHEVLTAEDAEQGLAMAQTERSDLILMDIGLPDLDGWTATRRLKAHPATQQIPIIALTAHAMQGDRERRPKRVVTLTRPSRSISRVCLKKSTPFWLP